MTQGEQLPFSDIQKAIEQVLLTQGVSLSWVSLLLTGVVCTGAAALGTWLTVRFTKAAEHAAYMRNFDDIREKLRITTSDSEQIKGLLSMRSWLQQQQWVASERYYTQLLSALHRFRLGLDNINRHLVGNVDYLPATQLPPEKSEKLYKVCNEALAEVESLVGAGALYLSDEASSQVDRMLQANEEQRWDSLSDLDYSQGAYSLANDAYAAVLAIAKQRLGLDADFAPNPSS